MSGHNRWSQIKHKKAVVDQRRSRLFAKLLNAISVAARSDTSPQFNPRLKSAIQKAREANIPSENIERAIKKSKEAKNLEEIRIEMYGPEKSALIIEAIADNKNRALADLKKIIKDNNGKIAKQGSVLWTFNSPTSENPEWTPKFRQSISDEGKKNLDRLIQTLESHKDVQKVITNIK